MPSKRWISLSADDLEAVNEKTTLRMSNNQLSPGAATYVAYAEHLKMSNEEAYHGVLESARKNNSARLGDSYEFFKVLESFAECQDARSQAELAKAAERRGRLLTTFTKMVTRNFNCDVVDPRVRPLLCIRSYSPHPQKSTFPSSVSFVHRIPQNAYSARAQFVEGPVCALSCRPTLQFEIPSNSMLDLAREVNALLITAQHRAREDKREIRLGLNQWWTTKARWGGGSGGPIGAEAERWEKYQEELSKYYDAMKNAKAVESEDDMVPVSSSLTRPAENWHLRTYDQYRMVRPPRLTWDNKMRHRRIGTLPGEQFDNVFGLSCINHHISMTRMRVPNKLLDQLDGQDGPRDECKMWRSKWWDMYDVEDRIDAMSCVWGMMAYTMRAMPEPPEEEYVSTEVDTSDGEL